MLAVDLRPPDNDGAIEVGSRRAWAFVVASLVLAGAAAALTEGGSETAAALVWAAGALVACLLGGSRLSEGFRPVLTPLVAISVSQVVAVSLPLPHVSFTTRSAAVGVLGLLVAVLALRADDDPVAALGLRTRPRVGGRTRRGHVVARTVPDGGVRLQLLVCAAGVVVGVLASFALSPRPAAPSRSLTAVVAEVLVLGLLVALPEEIVFRGLLAPATRRVVGPTSLLVDGALYAAVYAGSRSAAFCALAVVVGASASWVRLRTGRLWGVVAGHWAASVVALMIVPALR